MAVIVNGVVFVNGMAIGYANQLKNNVNDGTTISIEYDRPKKYEITK